MIKKKDFNATDIFCPLQLNFAPCWTVHTDLSLKNDRLHTHCDVCTLHHRTAYKEPVVVPFQEKQCAKKWNLKSQLPRRKWKNSKKLPSFAQAFAVERKCNVCHCNIRSTNTCRKFSAESSGSTSRAWTKCQLMQFRIDGGRFLSPPRLPLCGDISRMQLSEFFSSGWSF